MNTVRLSLSTVLGLSKVLGLNMVLLRIQAALVIALVLANASHAVLVSFQFSFSDDPADALYSNFHVPGTVTGRILGLEFDGFNQTPQAIFIDSHPTWEAGFGAFDATGIDLVANATSSGGGFNVVGGVITGLNIPNGWYSTFTAPNGGGAALEMVRGQTSLRHTNTAAASAGAVGNTDGMAGITFQQIATIPEPSMFVAWCALTCLGVAARHRKPRLTEV